MSKKLSEIHFQDMSNELPIAINIPKPVYQENSWLNKARLKVLLRMIEEAPGEMVMFPKAKEAKM